MGESIVAVLDPKSALAVAVNVAEEKVASLSAANASAEQIAAAVNQLENLKIQQLNKLPRQRQSWLVRVFQTLE